MAFATFNSADTQAGLTLSNGDLTLASPGLTGISRCVQATPVGSKTYIELTIEAGAGSAFVGVCDATHQLNNVVGGDTNDDGWGYESAAGRIFSLGGVTVYGDSWNTSSDIVGVAWDQVLGAIWFSKNGTWQNSATIGEIEAGTTTNAAAVDSILENALFFAASVANRTVTINFGDSAFSGTVPTGFDAGFTLPGLDVSADGAIILDPVLEATATIPGVNSDGAIDLIHALAATSVQNTAHTDGAVNLVPVLAGTAIQATVHADAALTLDPSLAGTAISGTPHLSGGVVLPMIVAGEFLREEVAVDPDEFDIKYFFTMTGAPDGLPDIEIPIRSLQSQFKIDGSSFLQVVIPDGGTYVTEITSRSNGELVAERQYTTLAGMVVKSEIARAPFSSINRAQGPTSYSLQVLGNTTFEFEQSRRIVITVALQEGTNRIRIPPNNTIRPADILSFDGADLQVETVTLNVSEQLSTMDISTGG